MSNKYRWRRVVKLAKKEITLELSKINSHLSDELKSIELGTSNTSPYNPTESYLALHDIFVILYIAVPDRVLKSRMFNVWENNREIYDLQEELDLWFVDFIKQAKYKHAEEYALTNQYISDNNDILKCPYCHSKTIKLEQTANNDEDGYEGIISCSTCSNYLSDWYYGNADIDGFLNILIKVRGW